MDSRSGTSILMLQIEKGDIQSVKQCLIQHPELLNKQNNSGNSPLTIAIRINNLPIISTLLLQTNSQINLRNKSGQTPLFIATFSQKISAVQLLLSFEADPSIPDFRGWTPLMVAVSKGNKDIVLELLSRGNYGVFFRNSLGESVFDLAKTKDMLECLMQGSGLNAEEIESNLGQSVLCSLRGKLAVCPADVDVKVNSVNRAVMRVQKSFNSATKNHQSSKQLEKVNNSSNIPKTPMNLSNISQNSHLETRKLKQALEDISRVNRRLEDRFTSEKQSNTYFLNESCSRSGIKNDASYSSNKYDNSEDSKSKYYDASNSSSSFSNKKSRSSHKKNYNENDESSFLQGQQHHQIIGGMSPLSSNKSSNSFFSCQPNQRKQQQIFQQQQQTTTPSKSQIQSAQQANLPKTSSNNSSYLVFPGNVTSDSTTSSNSQKQLRQQILLTPPEIQRNHHLQPPQNHSNNINNNNLSYLSNGSNSETASSSYNLGHNNERKMHQPDTNILQPSSPSFISANCLKNDFPEKLTIGNSITDNNHMDYMNLTSSEIVEKTSQRVLMRMAEITLTSVESMDQQFGMGVRTFLQQAVNNVNLTMLEKMKVLRTFEEQTIQEFAEQNRQDVQEQRSKQVLIDANDDDEQIEQLLPLTKEHSPTISNEVIMFQAKNSQSRYQIDGIVEQPTLEMIETPPTQGQTVQSLLLKKFSSQKQLESQRIGKMNNSKMSQKDGLSVSEPKGQCNDAKWNFKGIDLESDYRFEQEKDQQNQEQTGTQNNCLSRKIIKNTQLSHLANQQEITIPICQEPQNKLLNSQGIQRNSYKSNSDLKNAKRGFLTLEKQKKVISGSGSKTNSSFLIDKNTFEKKLIHRNKNGQYFQELLSPKELPDSLKIPFQRSAQTFPSHLQQVALKYANETHQKQRDSHGFLSVQLNQQLKEGTLPIDELQAQEDRNSSSQSSGRNSSDFSLSPPRDISLSPPRDISPCDHEEDHEQFEEDEEAYDDCYVEVEDNNKNITNNNNNNNNTHSQADNLTLSPPRKISSSPKQSSSSASPSVSERLLLKNTINSQLSVKNNDSKTEKESQNKSERATLTQDNKDLEIGSVKAESFKTPSCSSQSSAKASQVESSKSLKSTNLFETQLEQTRQQFLTESKKPEHQDQDVIHSAIMKRLETMQKTLNAKLFQINSRKGSSENSENNSNTGKI